MPIPEIIATAPRAQNPVFQDVLNWRGSLGIYDSLMGGNVPDLSAIDFGLNDYVFDPDLEQSPEQQILAYVDDFSKALRGMVAAGTMTPKAAAEALQGAWRAVGATDSKGNPVVIDPNSPNASDPRYGASYTDTGLIKLPNYTESTQSGGASAADAVGALMGVFTGVFAGGGMDGGGSGDSGSNASTAPSTPTAPATGSATGTGVSGNEGVGTGGGFLGGANGTNPDGTPVMEGTGPISVRTPEQQWQDILNDPNVDVAGAVAAAELIFGNSPQGVAAVVDAANARGVSAEDIANNSNYSLSDIIAAANDTGKVFTRETNTPATVVTPPTEVIPPAPPTPNPPIMPPAASTGPSGAEAAPPVIVPPTPPQEVIAPSPTVPPRPLQQEGFEGETGAETAPGTVDATDPDVTDPGDTGGGDDGTGNEGDGTGDGDGTGNGNGNGINIDLGGLFGAISPTPITDSIFAPEKVKFNRLPLDITNTLFGGFRR